MTLMEHRPPVIYPDSDGLPMSDNTTHADAIEYLHGVCNVVLHVNERAFAAADHFWYYVEGDPTKRVAPDVYVVFGRPKGHRGRYLQWMEEGLAPQFVFEVVSPNNRAVTADKLFLYARLGVEEYVVYDPGYDEHGGLDVSARSLRGFRQGSGRIELIDDMAGWTSPRLGITFGWDGDGLLLLRDTNGVPYPRYPEALAASAAAQTEAEAARAEAEAARADADAARADADAARARAARLAERLEQLRAMGVDVDGAAPG